MQLLLAGIVVLGVLSHWLAWRLRLPSILFLLLIGLLVGPVTGVVRPDEIFGESLFPFVSLSVAIILFEGSLTLRWAELRGIGAAVWGLVTVGAAVTFALVTLFAHWLLGMPLALAALVGAICTVTGPTVVVPMLRAIRPVASVSKTLRWEGIVVDPIGAMLAILVVEFMRSRSLEALAVELGWLLGAGVGAGLIGGFGLAFLLRRHLIPWYLRNVVALAFVLAVFAVSNQIAHEAGLLAVTVMGVALANMRQINVDDILDFKESLTLLLVAVLFITLAARLDFAEFASMSLGLPVFLLAVIFVARPVAVFVSTAFSRLGLREKLLISWVSPRGIVAAAVASLFALELRDRGVDGAELLVPTIFSVIVGTVLLQSATAGRVAAWLRLSNPDPRGIIILGAGAANRAFARKLKERDYPVLFVDSVWEDVRRARMDGFETYYGRIVSEHAERLLETGNYAYLFAMSPRRDQNTLAALHLRPGLGTHAVFALQTDEQRVRHMQAFAGSLRVAHLFGKEFTDADWERLVGEGAEFRVTRFTESFGWNDYRESIPGEFLPLLGIDPRGRLHPFTDDAHPILKPGWQIVSLLPKATIEAETLARDPAEKAADERERRARASELRPNPKPVDGGSEGGGNGAPEGDRPPQAPP